MASPVRKLDYETDVKGNIGQEEFENVAVMARRLGVVDELEQITAATERFFPDLVKVEVMWDPEIDDLVFLVFNVVAHGPDDDVMARLDQWYQETSRIAGKHANYFTISVDVE